jgi:hypothetical protein
MSAAKIAASLRDWLSGIAVLGTTLVCSNGYHTRQGCWNRLTDAGFNGATRRRIPLAELRLVSGVSLLGKFDGQFANRSQTSALPPGATFGDPTVDSPKAALCSTAKLTG